MKSEQVIWVLEDDSDVEFVYREILELRYRYRSFSNLGDLKNALKEMKPGETPDLLVADLRLPDGNFLSFLGKESEVKSLSCSIIIVSSCDDLDILRTCFNEGAADYLTKPFTKAELIVKVERLMSKQEKASCFPGVFFDPTELAIRRNENSFAQLTAKELQIFSMLHRAKTHGITRKEILSQVWKNISISSKTLDVHLFNLRRKLMPLNLEIRFSPPDLYALSGNGVSTQLANPSAAPLQ